MEQRISMIGLGTLDLKRAKAFYEALGWKAIEHEHGENIVFFQCGDLVFSLYPRDLLAEDAGVENSDAKNFSGMTLAYNVRSKDDVHDAIERAKKAGAKILKEPQDVFWGGYHAYFQDTEGHTWEVAFNPFTLPDAQGRFIMEGCDKE